MKNLKLVDGVWNHWDHIEVESESWLYQLDKYYIAELWIKYWGSFQSALWKALYNADHINAYKILENWKSEINLNMIYREFWEKAFNQVPF